VWKVQTNRKFGTNDTRCHTFMCLCCRVSPGFSLAANYVSALKGWFANVLPDLPQESFGCPVPTAECLLMDGKQRNRRLSYRHLSLRPARLLGLLPYRTVFQLPAFLHRRRDLQLRFHGDHSSSYFDCASARDFRKTSTLLLSTNDTPVSTKAGTGEKEFHW
jgi:hypothetical protein